MAEKCHQSPAQGHNLEGDSNWPPLSFSSVDNSYLIFGNHVFLSRVSLDGTELQVLVTDFSGNILGVDYDYRLAGWGRLELSLLTVVLGFFLFT